MKILHLPSSFFPSHIGGKEVFVYQLIKNTPQYEHAVLVHSRTVVNPYVYDGVNVHVLMMPQSRDLRESYFNLLYDDISDFENFLENFAPDVVHFHDQSESASLSHLKACKRRDIKTILSYHSPGQSCLQRSLLYANKERCDGLLDSVRCSSCQYQLKGVPGAIANLAAFISLPLDRSGRVIKRNCTELFLKSWEEFYSLIDCVQVHAHWVRVMLEDNGVSPFKIKYIAMGGHASTRFLQNRLKTAPPLKIVFIGRCADIKGVHILIDAVKMLQADIEVHFLGPYWNDTSYGLKMLELINGDERFKKPRLINPNDIIGELYNMDVCVIPSLWPETGPFTIFDAFSAFLPVLGTNYAGIAERIKDGVNGLLFEWGDSRDLAKKLLRLINEPELLPMLQRGIEPNRTFAEMASDFGDLYKNVIS